MEPDPPPDGLNPVLPEFTGADCEWINLPCHLSSIITWFSDFAQWLPLKIYAEMLSALLAGLGMIEPPFTAADMAGAAGVFSDFGYFAGLVNLQFGISAVLAALGVRFLIRRIPFIG